MRRRLIDQIVGLFKPRTSASGKPGQPGKPGKPAGSGASARPAPGPEPSARDIAVDRVEFEYSPCIDGDPDPGEVVWTWVPYEEDPTQGKDRPVVILGRRADNLAGVPLTSKAHDNEAQVAVGTGSWDREGRPSYAKVERLLEIDPEQVRREGAIISRAHFDAVVAGVVAQQRRR